AGGDPPPAGRRRLLRHDRRPVRRDGRAVRAPPARDECLSAYLRLRPAVQAPAAARRAAALPAPREILPGLVDPAARCGRLLLPPGARRRTVGVKRCKN